MSRRQVVFLGPSLPVDEARAVLPDAIYLPPAAMGDVLSALRIHRPHAIGLVDGSFLGTMSVFHKELLYAIDQGVWVLGAASMGALRAADCAPYGVIGIGEIYRAYRTGALEDDDEVALAHADAGHGYRAQSDALVTIRARLAAAVAAGIIDAPIQEVLADRQKARWFPERSLRIVVADARAVGLADAQVQALSAFLRDSVVDPKRTDAIALLEAMRDLPDAQPSQRPRTVISPNFAATLARDGHVTATDGATVTADRLRRWAMLHEPQALAIMRAARERAVLARLAVMLMGPPSEEDLAAARERVLADFGVSREAWADEAERMNLDERAEAELVRSEASIDRLMSSFIGQPSQAMSTTPFLNALRRSGDYSRMRDAAVGEHHRAEGTDLGDMSAREIVLAFADLASWAPPADLDAYLHEHLLGNPQELLLMMSITVRAARAAGDERAVPIGPSPHAPGIVPPDLQVGAAAPRASRGR